MAGTRNSLENQIVSTEKMEMELIDACLRGREDVAFSLLSQGVGFDRKDEIGQTAFVWASRNGMDEIVSWILGQDTDVIGRDGFSSFMRACQGGCYRVVKLLLQHGVDVNAAIVDKDSAISVLDLYKYGSINFNKSLPEQIEKLDVSNRLGETALMWACGSGNVKLVELLIDHGVEVNARSLNGFTALMFASRKEHGDEKVAEVLIKHDAEMDVQNVYGNTALMEAAGTNVKVMELLIDHGADVNLTCDTGETALLLACYHGHEKVVDLLLERSVSVNVKNVAENTALMSALNRGNKKIVEALLDHGADVNIMRTVSGGTVLIDACVNRQENMVRILLKHGANVDVQCKTEEQTAVMRAVANGSVECLQALLLAGPDLDLVDMDGQTVFSLAMDNRNTDCLKVLLEEGKLLVNGRLKPVHKNANIYDVSCESLLLTIKLGLFEWKWCLHRDLKEVSLAALESGLSPGKMKYNEMNASPLVVAFLENDIELITIFLERLYYFPEDYRTLCTDENIRQRITNTDILDEFTLQPLSLQTWSFLTVSFAISISCFPEKRYDRVESLSIPDKMKRRLNFR